MTDQPQEELFEVVDTRAAGFFIIDNEILDDYAEKIGLNAFAVYTALCRYARGSTCYPSIGLLARKLSVSQGVIRDALQTLAYHGLIKIAKRQAEDGRQQSNLYQLLPIRKAVAPPPKSEGSPLPDSAGSPSGIRSHKKTKSKKTKGFPGDEARPIPDPRIKILIDRFFQDLEKKLGEKPTAFNGPAAASGFKKLLISYGAEPIMTRFADWFESDDKHITSRAWRVEDFFTYFNALKDGPILSWESRKEKEKDDKMAWMK